MRCRLKCHNERNPCRQLPTGKAGDSGGTATARCEEGGDDVKSARPLRPGRHTCYNGGHRGKPPREGARIRKSRLSSDWSLQPDSTKLDSLVIAHQPWRGEYVPEPDSTKLDSLVIAHQPWRGEYVPGPCTHRPSSHGSRGRLKAVTERSGLGRKR